MSLNDIMAELQKVYIDSFPQKIETIQKGWDSQNLELIEDEFHKIKGTGRSYGLPEVTTLGEAMEKICKVSPQALPEVLPLALSCFHQIYEARSKGLVPDLETMMDFEKIRDLRQSLPAPK